MNENKKLLTVSASPHIKAPENTRTVMIDVLIALLPALIWSVYVFSWRALTVTLISVFSCIIFEFLFEKLMKKPVTVLDFSAAVTGLLLAFSIPASVPLWLPVMGAFFAIVIVKQLFGGIGKNVVNPAIAARIFLFIAWPARLTDFAAPIVTKLSPFTVSCGDVTASATVLKSLKAGEASNVSLFDMFLGNMGGTIGEVSSVLLILGGLYLLMRRVITWHIPVSFIGTVAVLTFVFPKVDSVQAYEFMLSEILSGGIILAAFFMATDYVTSPVTKTGRLIFGFGCGAITVFIRYFGGFPEGVSFAVMIMNLLVWYIDKFTRPKPFGAVKQPKKTKAQ